MNLNNGILVGDMGTEGKVSVDTGFGATRFGVMIAYYATLGAFFAASFFPHVRLWGIDWWAYYPLYLKIGLLALGGGVPFVAQWWVTRSQTIPSDISDQTLRNATIAMYFGFSLLFFFIRTRTHFLGDGYQILESFSASQAHVKLRDWCSVALPRFVMHVLDDRTATGALAAYQLVSIAAGVASVAVVAAAVRQLFVSNIEKLLITLVVVTGGYGLLFFGYVENYPLFVLVVGGVVLVGLLFLAGKTNRYWLLLLQALAIMLHVFGMMLLPATLYAVLRDTRVGKRIAALSAGLRWVLVAAVALFGVATFGFFFNTSYFFRFAFLPPVQDRFTVEGYTMLSSAHFLDMVNLLLMLVPSLAVLGILAVCGCTRDLRHPPVRFLLLASLFCLGGVFLFNPKLGMPRDWDLFSFCGVPLMVTALWIVFQSGRATAARQLALVLLLALNVAMLLPRAVAQAVPDLGIRHFRNYADLDVIKNYTARSVLATYYRSTGDSAGMNSLVEAGWDKTLPTQAADEEGDRQLRAGDIRHAKESFERAIILDPVMYAGWNGLGQCFMHLGNYDSALTCFRIADGLNPYNKFSLGNLGQVYFRMRDYANAEKYYHASLELDSLYVTALIGLANMYRQSGQKDEADRIARRLAGSSSVSLTALKSTVEQLIESKSYAGAAELLRVGLSKGLDTEYVRELQKAHPELVGK